jgi:hypothetical protein
MSKRPGRIQRAIKGLFDAEPDNAFTTTELCERVYGVKETDKRHRIGVIRAAKKISGLDHLVGENLGKQLVFYDPLDVMSYAMARLKADFLENYRNADPRCPPHWKNDTEADLRAKLANDERYRKLISEGGSWWLCTEISRAKARGDEKRAAKLQAQADEIVASVFKRIGTLKLPGQ